ncbi:hypothetical protein J6590_081093 [Homalodisca vitripennis]|nr:hypothetical protein J6590_081093 [Homalodisca vitripennis]
MRESKLDDRFTTLVTSWKLGAGLGKIFHPLVTGWRELLSRNNNWLVLPPGIYNLGHTRLSLGSHLAVVALLRARLEKPSSLTPKMAQVFTPYTIDRSPQLLQGKCLNFPNGEDQNSCSGDQQFHRGRRLSGGAKRTNKSIKLKLPLRQDNLSNIEVITLQITFKEKRNNVSQQTVIKKETSGPQETKGFQETDCQENSKCLDVPATHNGPKPSSEKPMGNVKKKREDIGRLVEAHCGSSSAGPDMSEGLAVDALEADYEI